jgi:UDP-N-acetylglucosamine 2-epimerase (non-hydrolysing)
LAEGFRKEHIFVTGSPMREVLLKHKTAINQSEVLNTLGLEKNKYILVSAHREENIDIEQNFITLMNAINAIAERHNFPVIYSTHPRSMKFIEKRNFTFNPLVRNMMPFGFLDYNKLQMNAFCVLSDSGTLSEECAMLGFPGILLRTSTERPEVIDKGNMVIGGIDGNAIEQAIELAVAMKQNNEHPASVPDYDDTNVSMKVIKIIQSFTKIVDKVVWGKNENTSIS